MSIYLSLDFYPALSPSQHPAAPCTERRDPLAAPGRRLAGMGTWAHRSPVCLWSLSWNLLSRINLTFLKISQYSYLYHWKLGLSNNTRGLWTRLATSTHEGEQLWVPWLQSRHLYPSPLSFVFNRTHTKLSSTYSFHHIYVTLLKSNWLFFFFRKKIPFPR